MGFDAETWQRTVFEALRPIDPQGLFNVAMLELDFRDVADNQPEDFPGEDLAQFVNDWLVDVDPDEGVHETEWSGGGVHIRLQARGRGKSWRGFADLPSFNLLEQEMDAIHLVDGGRRRFIDLSLEQIERLADGSLQTVGQGASYQDTFRMLAGEMRHFGWRKVADLPSVVMTAYAGMLGLVGSPPDLGNYDATWRALHRQPRPG